MNISKDWNQCIELQWEYNCILCAHLLNSPTSFPISLCLTPQQLFHFSTELCTDPIDGSPSGSPVPGILQVRTLEWVAISFSSAWKWKVKVKSLSRVWLIATPWIAAYQVPPSMGFSRQEYWSGVPLPSPDLVLSQGQNHTLGKTYLGSSW